jgi:transposase
VVQAIQLKGPTSMLTHGEDVEVDALKERGWSITAIANHLGHDRKTIRAYLKGERTPGVRARCAPDPLEPFVPYLTQRLLDDPHVWASALFDEVRGLGYSLSYPSFARQVRLAALRPHLSAYFQICSTKYRRTCRSARLQISGSVHLPSG